jgi:ABC-type antimicrobial peptide transport system permease subunit
LLVFVARRLLSVVAVMVGVAALVFSVFYAFRPEQVSDGTGYFHQLWHYVERAFLHFDLGTSYERGLGFQPIAPLLRAAFPADLSLVVGGLVVGTAAGVALGAVADRRRGTPVARALDVFAAFGLSAPVYWVGAMSVVFFHPEVGEIARLPISKPNTYQPLTHDPLAWLQALWLPWIVLGLPLAAITMRMMRASLAETFEEDFVRTARGKGTGHLAGGRDHGDGDHQRHPPGVHLQHPRHVQPHDAGAGQCGPAGHRGRRHRRRPARGDGQPLGRPRARVAGPARADVLGAREGVEGRC